MRVALVDPSLFTLPYDVALAGALRDEGVDVTLHGRRVTPEDGEPGSVQVQPSFYRMAGSAQVRRMPRAVRLALKGADHVASMRGLLGELKASPPNIIHFQWLPLPAMDSMFLPQLRRIAPVVLTVHDTQPFNGNPTARLQGMGFVRALRRCDRLIVHTAQGLTRLLALGIAASRICVLPHGPLATGAECVQADPMRGQMTFVLFGKIKRYKGADLLIEAFARVPEGLRSQARLRIVGQAYMDIGVLRELAAARLVADRVDIEARFVEDGEIADIFGAGAVAVFPYREIEASGVLSLALAAGRPIIASRLGSFADTLTDDGQGRLLPAGDVGALAEAMGAIIADRALAARYASCAASLARALPGWGEIAGLTRGLYAEMRAEAGREVNAAPGRHVAAQGLA